MEKLEKEIISEWEDFYINYKELHEILLPLNIFDNLIKLEKKDNLEKDVKSNDNSLNENLLSNNEQKEEESLKLKISGMNINDIFNKYFSQLDLEINKFSYFDNILQNKRHLKRFNEINEQLEYIENHPTMKMFKEQLGGSLRNFYREIYNYQLFINTNIKINNLNFDEIEKYSQRIKIINNQIDMPNLENKKNEINTVLEKANDYNQNLLKKIEEIYTAYFNDNYRDENKSKTGILKSIIIPEKEKCEKKNTEILHILIFIMFILGALSYTLANYLELDIDLDPEFGSVFPMYRTYGIICIYIWTLGLNVWVWNNSNINYKALFTFDNHYSTVTEIFIRAAFFTNILFLAFFLYMITRTQTGTNLGLNQYGVDGILPGLMWLILILYFFWPFKTFNYYGRIYTMRLFGECIASILIPIEFKHIWFMDQLTSLIGPMRDIEYTLCYYSFYVNPFQTRELFCSNTRVIYLIIAIFPNFFRILQVGRQIIDNGKICPYIFNIGKYTFNIIVASFSFLSNSHPNYFIYWIFTAFISGCYSSYWDIKMDFGYFETGAKNWPLRDKSKFKNKLLCYLAIPIDIILRFLWMLSISHEIMERIIRPEFLALILYTLEMIRRAQWNFIRVEYEHFELVKGYQISYYEELPLIKLSNGKYMTNEHNLLNILNIGKHDRIRLELRELFSCLEKNKENEPTKKETSLTHLKEEKKYANSIINQLNEYLVNYKKDTKNNLDLNNNY